MGEVFEDATRVNNPTASCGALGEGESPPQDYGQGRFHPATKLTGIQQRFL